MKKTPWNYALTLLARREYSRKELYQKMDAHFPECSHQEIEDVLDRLLKSGLQSDERMADAWARFRYQKGKGPLLIAKELAAKGISDRFVRESISQPELEWLKLVEQVARKKLLLIADSDQIKLKLTRFLSGRGFSFEQIDVALENLELR